MKLKSIFSNLFRVSRDAQGFFYILESTRKQAPDPLVSFTTLPELNSVINLLARAWSNMRFVEVDKSGSEKKTPSGQKLIALLANPNWSQSGKEFLLQTKIFRSLWGCEFIFKSTAVGFTEPRELFSIPPNTVKVDFGDKPVFLADEEALRFKVKISTSTTKNLSTKEIIYFADQPVGTSKTQALKNVVENLKLAYEARGMILKYRGANGAWVNESKDAIGQTLPLNEKEKAKIEEAFEKYGTAEWQHQTIVTDLPLRWVQAGTNDPLRLGIFSETRESFFKIIDTFGVPAEMFARDGGATYENQRQAEKGFYLRTVIPDANEWIGGVDYDLRGADRETNIIADFSHLHVFQDEIKLKAEAMNALINALSSALSDGAITLDDYKKEMKRFIK